MISRTVHHLASINKRRRVTTYVVVETREAGSVNFRTGPLAPRDDNRYPGDWSVRRHESGGLELTFTGSQHNSRDVVKVIPPNRADHFILSCLEVTR